MAKKRITITIEDNIPDGDALQCVMQIVDMGKISGNGKFYCASTLLQHPKYPNSIVVYTSTRTKENNSSFHVMLGN